MAQSSAGIRLYWCSGATISVDGSAALPSGTVTWNEIPDVTSIPALGGEPNMLDATVLSETVQKRYIPGLKDPGGSLGYAVLMTPAMLSSTNNAVNAYATGAALNSPTYTAFAVQFPAPLNKYYWYVGQPVAVTPGETEVDGVLSSTFYTSVGSTIKMEDGAAQS